MQNASENALINQLENISLQELSSSYMKLHLSLLQNHKNSVLLAIEREKNDNKVSRNLFGALLTFGLIVLIFSSVIISFGFFLPGVPLFILSATATIAGGVGLFKTNKMAEEIEKHIEEVSPKIQDIDRQIQDLDRQINPRELSLLDGDEEKKSLKKVIAEKPVTVTAFPSLDPQPDETESDEITTNSFRG